MIRRLILVLAVVAIGAGCLWLGERGARAVERLLAERAVNAMAVLGVDWAGVTADGLGLELRGHAPNASAHALALEAARAAAPFARVVDRATVTKAPQAERVPVQLELMRDGDSVVATGRFHGERMRAELAGKLARSAPGLELRDLTGVNAAPPPPGWGPELSLAARAAAGLEDAYVRIEPGAVRISGAARDGAHRETLTEELLALAGEAVRLTLDLREPPRVVTPFVFAVSKDAAGGVRRAVCHARDPEEAARLEAALGRLGIVQGERRCPVALGGPAGDWSGAVEAGLGALGDLPAGMLRLEDRSVRLVAAEGVDAAEAERARADLAAALPEGYALAGPGPDDAAAGEAGDAGYRLRFSRSDGAAMLRGLVASETARRMVVTYAEARLGPAETEIEPAPEGIRVPAGWEPAALAALDALSRLAAGEAELAPGLIRLIGRVTDPVEAGRIHRETAAAAPEGYTVETALSVDLPAAVAAVPLSPARCAALLNARIERQPIGFAPGDAVFEPGNEEIIDGIAGILGRCDGARIEVGGHTDNRGPEDLNQRLSRRRAEAVLDALIERGVPLSMLAARGYGEDEPVATNGTEEGRARNRRIAFRAIDCSTRQSGC